MEILSFTLGMLAIVAIALVITIVVGIVKVFRQQRELKSTQEWLSNHEQYVNTRFIELERTMNSTENNIYNAIGEQGRDTHQRIEAAYTNARDMANAYTDSRIDKLTEKLANTKQVIKG
jgi:ABC-type siderophore export system fused ATPase/permease subunit